MPSKFSIAMVLLSTGLLAGTVQAQVTPPAPVQPQGWDACAVLNIDPIEVYNTLAAFGEVFGKKAIDWNEKDYLQVQELANACNGVAFTDGSIVDAMRWHNAMERGIKNVFEVAYVHQEIMRMADSMRTDMIELPPCGDLVKYELPTKHLHDNSKDIFGTPLYGMTESDLNAAIQHMNNCMAFLPDHGFEVFQVQSAATRKAVYGMMDRALTIQAWHEDWKTWTEKRPTDIIVEFEGYLIPPTFLSDEGKAMVRRYNRAASRPNGMTIDAVYNLVSITEGILEEDLSDIDHAYANAVKKAVSQYIFDASGAASGVGKLP